MALEQVVCNLCGASDSRIRYQSDPAEPSDPGQFAATTDVFGAYGTVRECLACGLLYTSPRLKAAELMAGYERTEDPDYIAESDSRSINAYLCLARIRRHAVSGRLLEIGCSTGFFLNAARTSFEVTGVEPSREASRYARERLKLAVPAATLEEARFPDGHFDVVALIDVIEHVADPLGLMREVGRVTKPGGIVYLVTPDIGSFSAAVLRSRWWGLRPAHIYYFSRKTLAELLARAGFETISLRSYGRIFTWQYWLSRLVNYPRFIYRCVEGCIRLLGIEDKFLYLDTRDSMEFIARKKP